MTNLINQKTKGEELIRRAVCVFLAVALLTLTTAAFSGCKEWFKPKPATYSVTFVMNNGEPNRVVKYTEGAVIEPPSAEKSGYSFLGWYTDSGFSQKFTDGATAASDITLYAKFEEITVIIKITFVMNNGEPDLIAEYAPGSVISLPRPNKDGHVFDGWYRDADFSQKLADGTKANFDRTLYAKFIKIHSVSGGLFDLDGNPINAGSIAGLGEYSDGTRVQLRAVIDEGYVFDGWYKDGAYYSSDKNITITVTADAVYNVRVVRGVTVRADYFDGVAGGVLKINGQVVSSYLSVEGSKITLSAEVLTGYVFDGWYKDGGDSLYSSAPSFEETLTGGGTVLFKAKFSYVGYEIETDVSPTGGGGITLSPQQSYYHINDTVTVLAAAAQGYFFDGLFIFDGSGYVLLSDSPNAELFVSQLAESFGELPKFLLKAEFINADNSAARYSYESVTGGVKITGVISPFASVNAAVPERINGLTVLSIACSAFDGVDGVEMLILPSGLTEFSGGTNPFGGMAGLKFIRVASGNAAFSNDENGILYDKSKTKIISCPRSAALTSLVLPVSVQRIGAGAFEGQKNITSVTALASLSNIGNFAFRDAKALTQISVASSPSSFVIDSFAFFGCDKLAVVNINISGAAAAVDANNPRSAQSSRIMQWAFSGCKSLTAQGLTLNGIKGLYDELFAGCVLLTEIYLPSSLVFIAADAQTNAGSDTFRNSAIQSIYVDGASVCYESVDGVLYDKFNAAEKRLVRCPEMRAGHVAVLDGTAIINDYAFANCAYVTSIDVPSSVRAIGAGAFLKNISLAVFSIAANSTVSSIKDYAFFGCSSLMSLSLPSSVLTIGEYSIAGCSSLLTLNLGEGLTDSHSTSFNDCSSLEVLAFPSAIFEIGDRFGPRYGVGVGDDGANPLFLGCSSLQNIYVGIDSPRYRSIDGVLYKGDNAEKNEMLIKCPETKTGLIEVASDYIVKIANYAFYKSAVSEVWFNFSIALQKPPLLYIGTAAFAYSALSAIALPSSVIEIGAEAFYACSGLIVVGLSYDLKKIGASAFSGCAFSEIIITEYVTEIGSFAFSHNLNLQGVYVKAENPPAIAIFNDKTGGLFEGCVHSQFAVYVRKSGSSSNVSKYKAVTGWKDYSSKITDWNEGTL
ncbi:MAG: leucine-rich repeat protein [Clostridiales bacterium]|jgi:uncharacterized repeat protein (TIGR02543 family)|nr:leucine-rich repeat protein [Clostridiales bacterium]